MEPDRWRQIDDLLEQVLERPAACRVAFVDTACGGDEALRVQVHQLLRAHERAADFLATPALESAFGDVTREQTDTLIGRTLAHYHIISRLGAGGMGVVYLARDTRLERLVALKFLRLDATLDEEQKLRFIREAKASAALEHVNIAAVHEIAEAADGRMFIVMAYYQGETLRQRLQRGPLPAHEAVDIARQMASGLAHAHGRGMVHRDVKPGNVLITPEGVVKIIDFGLAKSLELSTLTRADRVMGTLAYVSPEQARGEAVDQRSDVWSLGAVLYEMLAGQVAFRGEHPAATVHNILNADPPPVTRLRPEIPAEMDRILRKALEKDQQLRYQSAAELLTALMQCESSVTSPGHGASTRWGLPRLTGQRRVAIPVFLILVGMGTLLTVSLYRASRVRWATNLLPEISRLADQDQYGPALALALEAERYIPGDSQLAKLWPVISASISVNTTPPGATVFMKEYHDVGGDWTQLGTSPLENIRIPHGLFRWKVEKAGFATRDDLARSRSLAFVLDPLDSVPEGMVRVQGGASPNKMTVSGFEHVETVQLQDYWMDRHEVTNAQFKRFVDGGGYLRREHWRHAFVRDGGVLSWGDAMNEFRDATGRPGPSTWEGGDYPDGQDDYPVGGVSWYEAAAFCEFAGKALPTVYHWNRAAINGEAWFTSHILPLSNFAGRGPARAGSYQGMSRSGTYDLAGNVKEWSWNAADQHKRYILGGAWNEPAYMFHEADARSPFQRDATFGFRCIKHLPQDIPSPRLRDAVAASTRNYAKEQPVPEHVFRAYQALYAYDRVPLNPTIESVDTSEADWTREKITFTAAYGNERMTAYLFLPKQTGPPPYQTVVHFPGAESLFVRSSDRLVEMSRIDFLLKSGRAVLWPIYSGTYERQDGMQTYFPDTSIRYRDRVIQWAKDLGRSIDYLDTRPEIDHDALAYYGFSWGGCMGAILPAVENRLKVSILMGPGLYLEAARPEVDQINFAPRVTIPTLILDGRDDFVFPRETSQEPFYRLLGTPKEHKRLVLLEGGHSVPRHHLIRESLDWLDRYFGEVQRRAQ
ncbi:MAG TPA: protein kinase [Vicinamibacterales bacterium]|nr:protein kinase [Vicinamibacterales bacterium]